MVFVQAENSAAAITIKDIFFIGDVLDLGQR